MNEFVLRFQKLVNNSGYTPWLKLDGIYGPATESGIKFLEDKFRPSVPTPSHSVGPLLFDARTEACIATLLPDAQTVARRFMDAILQDGIIARIISGTRTFDEQNKLYEQGRTEPGKIVTRARGGQSWHNWGVAWDIGIFDSSNKYLEESVDYARAGEIGESLGLEWGGRWATPDGPHFQLRPESVKGMTDAQAFITLAAEKSDVKLG